MLLSWKIQNQANGFSSNILLYYIVILCSFTGSIKYAHILLVKEGKNHINELNFADDIKYLR